jgi:polyisoprenoid-binding protein YceI
MKFIYTCLFFFSLILPAQAAETFILDPLHSYVLWHASHFDFSHPSGKWMVNGTVTLDKDHPQASKVDVSIKLADLITGIPELDKHLKGELFFNVAKYPLATFVSDKVTDVNNNSARVEGMLTLHGVSKPVTLDVKMNKLGVSPITDKMTAGFTASTTIKRSDFGINTLLPGVGDEVKIEIEAEAMKK